MTQRHIRRQPQRTCIACGRTDAKRQLIRLVRRPDGQVVVDPTGKLAGRGAYLCKTRACWERAFQQKRIGRALKTDLTAEQQAQLAEFAKTLPEEEAAEAAPSDGAPNES
ncbi:MAG: YlxR family protein [Chloroflexi bacterium]|nr:YlxR family protein [Chloroflexota bacterium]MBC7255041.1 YlxR family protein [Chloroflexota bacterium]